MCARAPPDLMLMAYLILAARTRIQMHQTDKEVPPPTIAHSVHSVSTVLYFPLCVCVCKGEKGRRESFCLPSGHVGLAHACLTLRDKHTHTHDHLDRLYVTHGQT